MELEGVYKTKTPPYVQEVQWDLQLVQEAQKESPLPKKYSRFIGRNFVAIAQNDTHDIRRTIYGAATVASFRIGVDWCKLSNADRVYPDWSIQSTDMAKTFAMTVSDISMQQSAVTNPFTMTTTTDFSLIDMEQELLGHMDDALVPDEQKDGEVAKKSEDKDEKDMKTGKNMDSEKSAHEESGLKKTQALEEGKGGVK